MTPEIGTIERAIIDAKNACNSVITPFQSDAILKFLKQIKDPDKISVNREDVAKEGETILISDFADPYCDKCNGIGRAGFRTVNGKRKAVLCPGKYCSRNVIQMAFVLVDQRKKKERMLDRIKQLCGTKKEIENGTIQKDD